MSYNRIAAAAILSGQYDDGLTTLYNVDLGLSPNHVQHTGGVTRTAVRVQAGSSGIGKVIQSVLLRYRKYGNPTGNITVNIRKVADDSAVLIGTWPIAGYGQAGEELQISIRNRFNQSYATVAGDHVSIEFPSNATDGFEISTNSTASDPANYTSRSWNGSIWSSALADPLAITIKGF